MSNSSEVRTAVDYINNFDLLDMWGAKNEAELCLIKLRVNKFGEIIQNYDGVALEDNEKFNAKVKLITIDEVFKQQFDRLSKLNLSS